jgi:hypothetical protein
MSSRLFPPPPLAAPMPSNTRPPLLPSTVIEVLVAAKTADGQEAGEHRAEHGASR